MCGLDYTPLGKQSPIPGVGEGKGKAEGRKKICVRKGLQRESKMTVKREEKVRIADVNWFQNPPARYAWDMPTRLELWAHKWIAK